VQLLLLPEVNRLVVGLLLVTRAVLLVVGLQIPTGLLSIYFRITLA
jgi:hypothetical protein